MADLKSEIWAITVKAASAVWSYFLLIMLGVLGMIGNNMYVGKKMSFWQSVGAVAIAMFIGTFTSIICYINGWDKLGAVLVPMFTLVADKVMLAILAIDWKRTIKSNLKEWLKSWVKKL